MNQQRRNERHAGAGDVQEECREGDCGNQHRHEKRSGTRPGVCFAQMARCKHGGKQAAAQQEHAGEVHAGLLVGIARAIMWHVAPCQCDHREPDRHVDEEDRAPAQVGHEQSTEHGADHGADRKDAAEQTDGLVARRAEMVHHDPCCRGREACAARCLQRAQRDQHVDVACQATAQRSQGEHEDRSEEYPALSVALAQLAADRQHQHEAERVGRDRPARPVDRRTQAELQRMQRRGDDRRVDRHHQQRKGDDCKHADALQR